MDVVMEGGGAGLPIACATWSCSGADCGYNTSYPAWACCVQNIYEGPGGYAEPLDSVPGFICGIGNTCDMVDNECYWHNEMCLADGHSVCDMYCGTSSACAADPVTSLGCAQKTDSTSCES